MSLIITFMFEPAKLQMNCASASGTSTLRSLLDGFPVATGSAMPHLARSSVAGLQISDHAAVAMAVSFMWVSSGCPWVTRLRRHTGRGLRVTGRSRSTGQDRQRIRGRASPG